MEAYLAALQDRGYTDVAIRYLDRMADSSLAPDTLSEELDYRKGMLLVASARSTRNTDMRRRHLNGAQQAFDRFLSNHSDHPNVVLARNQLGNILVERARSLTQRSAAADTANREALRRQAYDAYEEAYQALQTSKQEIGDRYRTLRNDVSKSQLNEIKTRYIQTYLALGRVLFEQAKTVDGDDARYQEKLRLAAQAFDEVAVKYRAYSAGLYATLYQGECYQLLGEDQRALSYFKELLQTNATSPIVRRLKTTALARSIDGWVKTDPKKGPDRGIQLADEWMKSNRGVEDRQPAWLELKLALAQAYLAKSKTAEDKTQAERATRSARDLARELAKRKSDVQEVAQQMLVALGNGELPNESAPQDPSAAQTFAEARDAAKSSLDAMKLASTTVTILSSQLKRISDPQRRTELEAKLSTAQAELETQSQAAVVMFQRADALATADDQNDLQSVRYYLAYLYYTLKDYRRAAVLAGHTALRYPDSIAAKECANVAIAARQRLYQELGPEDRATQLAAISKIGELLLAKWPDDPKAANALTTLLDVAITKGDLDAAESYLARIPATSPKRTAAELRFGQQLWTEYLRANAQADGTPDAETETWKQRALVVLKKGLEKSSHQSPTETAIRAALTLAKIYVDTGQPTAALELLRQEGIGAVDLIDANSPWLQRIPGLSTDGYTTAIRAHIASAAEGDSRQAIANAQQMLDELREDLRSQPDGDQRIIAIYVSLARDLERQLAVASPQAQAALSRGFESFLRQAAEGTRDLAVLHWVANTFYGMGNGLISGQQTSPEAQRYFTEATKAYDQVLAQIKTEPDAVPASTVLQIQVRQAIALRQTGKFQAAVDLLANVLAQKRYLNIQVEAAQTLQNWGIQGGNQEALRQAIMGTRPGSDGKNLIWGWGRIAKLVAREEKYRPTFHEARYNIARCRYEMAQQATGAQSQQLLVRAKADLLATQSLYGLGRTQQAKRYESLMKAIQKELGDPATGFPEP